MSWYSRLSNILNKYKKIINYLISIYKIIVRNYNTSNNLYHQLVRFFVVGLMKVGFFYITYLGLFELKINYLVASSIAFLFSTFFGYLFNQQWTFVTKNKISLNQGLKYLAVNIFMICLNLILIIALTEWLHISSKLSPLIAFALSPVISFNIYKWWVFKK